MNSLRLSPSHVSIFFPGACQWNSLAPGLLESKYYSLQHGTATLPPRERTEPEGKPHIHSHRTKSQFQLSRSQSMLLNAFTPCPHITPFIHLQDTGSPALQLCHYPPLLLGEHKQKRDGSMSCNFSHLHGGTSVWSTSPCGGWTWYRTGWDAGWRWHCCPLEKHHSERLIPLHFTHWKKPNNSDSKKKKRAVCTS